jgi:hypothetical protein
LEPGTHVKAEQRVQTGVRVVIMPDRESPAERYRRHAQECLKTAQTMSTQEGRTTLLEMARSWQRLAEQQEAAAPHQPTGDSKKQ